jgi:hypothetical protein
MVAAERRLTQQLSADVDTVMRMAADRGSKSGPYKIIEGAVKFRDGKRVSYVFCQIYNLVRVDCSNLIISSVNGQFITACTTMF